MASKPLIVKIKGNSLDDGPGIRSVVFFKGCPLSCTWCHNPECINMEQEIFFNSEICIGCGSCIEVCPEMAISNDNPLFINRSTCTLCLKCIKICPAAALTIAGSYWKIEAVVEKILKDKPFFDNSGGGITLSGGEPTLYPDYAGQLLRALKKVSIHTLIETCGHFNFTPFSKKMLSHVDIIFFDIKPIDPELHKSCCGISNEIILNNLIQLHELSLSGSFDILPRIPLIPGITATVENLSATASFLHAKGFKKAELVPYNPLWGEKLLSLGRPDPYPQKHPFRHWMEHEELIKWQQLFASYGF